MLENMIDYIISYCCITYGKNINTENMFDFLNL